MGLRKPTGVIRNIDSLPALLSTSQLSRLLGLSMTKIYILIHEEGFPKLALTRGCYRFRKEELLTWLEQHRPACADALAGATAEGQV